MEINSNDAIETKTTRVLNNVSDSYYWYKSEKVSLTLNTRFVNMYVDTKDLQYENIEKTLSEYGFKIVDRFEENYLKTEFISDVSSIDEYNSTIAQVQKSGFIKGIFPYYERGEGAEPIGTSDIFYAKLKSKGDVKILKDFVGKYGVTIVRQVPYMGEWYILSTIGSVFSNSTEASSHYYETGLFEAVDPAFMFNFRPNTIPNDPLFSQQWGLKKSNYSDYGINVEEAWETTTGTGVDVAVIDTPIQGDHLDLQSNISSVSINAMAPYSQYPIIPDSHGTHVAGIIAAKGNNSRQVIGVAHNSKIVRIGHDLSLRTNASAELAFGISWAWQTGCSVINCSWGDQGGLLYSNLHSLLLDEAISNALKHGRSGDGCVVVFAAGNYGVLDYPANSNDEILVVGSINEDGSRTESSAYGSKLDVVAPGENILSTIPYNDVGPYSGTSMAAPHVSGTAALVLSKNPNLSQDAVNRIIELSSQKIRPDLYNYSTNYGHSSGDWNQQMGYGLIDAGKAVRFATDLLSNPTTSGNGMYFNLQSGYYSSNMFNDSINLNSSSQVAYFQIPDNAFVGNYSYLWNISRSYTQWRPEFDFIQQGMCSVILPYPLLHSSETVVISCRIYDGDTLIATHSYTLTLHP